MSISSEQFEQVRRRAEFACEYCGVSETDAGGPLTVDHYRPRSHGGTDHAENLAYACIRCNLHKADFWNESEGAVQLLNPRRESAATHLRLGLDGLLMPLTPAGELTIARLRLNRPALIANRLRQLAWAEERKRRERIRQLAPLLASSREYEMVLDEEQREALEVLRELLQTHLDELH